MRPGERVWTIRERVRGEEKAATWACLKIPKKERASVHATDVQRKVERTVWEMVT